MVDRYVSRLVCSTAPVFDLGAALSPVQSEDT